MKHHITVEIEAPNERRALSALRLLGHSGRLIEFVTDVRTVPEGKAPPVTNPVLERLKRKRAQG